MAIPGEVNQSIGRAYQFTFIAALEGNIRHFENNFTVEQTPDKTTFLGRTGCTFSFDFNGIFRHPWRFCEVFGECKGYTKAGDLLNEFRLFLAKAYVACVDTARHKNDLFWFVTNVPFGCSEGRNLRNVDFVMSALTDRENSDVQKIIGAGTVDRELVRSLTKNLGVFILTDSYLMNARLSYKVKDGDTLWDILKIFHGGHVPSNFQAKADQIAAANQLKSPNKIIRGKRIDLSWYGLGD
ncbi:MAG: LysM peptidoglycan-binding domain-containing protein [Nitrososphaerales archaeon]